MKSIRTTFSALLVAIAACGAPQDEVSVAIGSPAPSFELEDLDGSAVASSTYSGRPALLNFWATWCQPCLKEEPELEALATSGQMAVVAIALDEKGAKTVAPHVEKHRPSFDILLGDQATFERFGGYTIPYSLLLDRQGKVLRIYRGPITRLEVEEDLRGAATPGVS